MQTPRIRRLVPWGGALALGLSAALTAAQDGAPATGPPVTNPRTDKAASPATPTTIRPRTSADILPGIPETARDPAPPGTRGVRVDEPNAAAPGAGPASTNPRILVAEGVVTRIDRAGKNVSGELERFAFDPSQDWFSYVNQGTSGVLGKDNDEDRPKTNAEIKAANAKQHEETPGKPKVMEMVITKRTYVYTHARSPDGTDQYGVATSSSPDRSSSRTGLTNRVNTAPVTGPVQTNFTNLKEGSFVSVRYRKVGDLNEVLNLTLIERPLNPEAVGGTPATPATPPRGTTAPVRVRGAGPAEPKTPVGVPTVPLAPVGADLPR